MSPKQLKRVSSSRLQRRFPKVLTEFQIFDRVDAQDHKGQWFSASIVEIVTVEKPIQKAKELLKDKAREKQRAKDKEKELAAERKLAALPSLMKRKSFSTNNTICVDNQQTETSRDPAKVNPIKSVELNGSMSRGVDQHECGRSPDSESLITLLRVHFDCYSAVWDEWFTQEDLSRLAPIYTKTQRKLKIFDLQIVQRRLNYYWKDSMQVVQSESRSSRGLNSASISDSNCNNQIQTNAGTSLDQCAIGKIDLLESPWVVQCESFRSVDHAYQHIVEQSLRFLSTS
jgi:hypothetical protein